jgi:hypothetical protein
MVLATGEDVEARSGFVIVRARRNGDLPSDYLRAFEIVGWTASLTWLMVPEQPPMCSTAVTEPTTSRGACAGEPVSELITIWLRRSPDRPAHLQADHGDPGMPAADKERVMRAFARADRVGQAADQRRQR